MLLRVSNISDAALEYVAALCYVLRGGTRGCACEGHGQLSLGLVSKVQLGAGLAPQQ